MKPYDRSPDKRPCDQRAVEPSSTSRRQRAINPLSGQLTQFIYGFAVCHFDVRALMPAQTRRRALSHRKVSIINLILSQEGMRAKETVHDP